MAYHFEMQNCIEEERIQWLARLFNRIIETKKMSDSYGQNIVILIYINKGEIQNCLNYGEMKPMKEIFGASCKKKTYEYDM